MPLDILQKSINLCKELNVQEIWLQNWGEPLLYPYMNKVIYMIVKENIKPCFITNGSLLNKSLIKYFYKIGLHKLNISFNASTPINFSFISHLYDMYDYANHIGLDCYFRSVVFSKTEYLDIYSKLKDKKVNWQRGMIHDDSKIRNLDCPAIDKNFIIYWDGTIVPCCQVGDNEIVYGNVLSCNTSTINLKIRELHRYIKSGTMPSICRHCFEVNCNIPIKYKLSE